jgi:hypothetical protein
MRLKSKMKDKMETDAMKNPPQKRKKKTKLKVQEEIAKKKNKLQNKTKDKMETDAMKNPPQKPKKTLKLTFQVKVDELVKLAQKKEAHLTVVLDVLKVIALRVKADLLKVDAVEENAHKPSTFISITQSI